MLYLFIGSYGRDQYLILFKGFEFSWKEIKTYWNIVKWELVRRLAPRVSAIIGVGLTITINPIYAAIKYWISNLMMLPEGWVDSMAGLLNSHVSRNVGLMNRSRTKTINLYFGKPLSEQFFR